MLDDISIFLCHVINGDSSHPNVHVQQSGVSKHFSEAVSFLWHFTGFQGTPSRINWGNFCCCISFPIFPHPGYLATIECGPQWSGWWGWLVWWRHLHLPASRNHIEVAFKGRQCWTFTEFWTWTLCENLIARERYIFMNCLCIHIILERMGVPKHIRWDLFWTWWLTATFHGTWGILSH